MIHQLEIKMLSIKAVLFPFIYAKKRWIRNWWAQCNLWRDPIPSNFTLTDPKPLVWYFVFKVYFSWCLDAYDTNTNKPSYLPNTLWRRHYFYFHYITFRVVRRLIFNNSADEADEANPVVHYIPPLTAVE